MSKSGFLWKKWWWRTAVRQIPEEPTESAVKALLLAMDRQVLLHLQSKKLMEEIKYELER